MSKYGVVKLALGKDHSFTNWENINRDVQDKLRAGNVIYVYGSIKTGQVYIGQTKQFLNRHGQHYDGHEQKFNNAKFDRVMVVYSSLFHGSALDDMERQLIMYFKADYKKSQKVGFEVVNGTNGNYVNNYKEQESILYDVLIPLWENVLYKDQWVHTPTLESLKSNVLTKYSPFKSLTEEQSSLIEEILDNSDMNFVINGDAGTGKTVLLTHLVADFLNKCPNKTVAIVVPRNWEKTANEIFKVYGFDNTKWTVWTSTKLIKSGKKYDMIIVDESHKLSRRGNKQQQSFNEVYKIPEFGDTKNHLEIIQKLGKQVVLMYDILQGIRPANIARSDYAHLTRGYEKKHLTTQFRIRSPKDASFTSDDYVNGIKWLLYKDTGILSETNFDSNFNRDVFKGNEQSDYFGYFDEKPLANLIEWIEEDRNLNEHHVNRIVGGLVEKWAQKDGKNNEKFHWFEDDIKRRWNSTQDNWINSTDNDAEDQIGSVFSVQGIDLNKVGVLIGDDLGIDEQGHLYAIRENFHNINGVFTNDEADLPEKKEEFTLFVLNIYYVLLTRGIDGVRIGIWHNEAFKKYLKDVLIKE